MNTDAAVPGLNRNNVYRLRVTNVSTEIIDAFTELITSLHQLIYSLSRESLLLANLRDTLLPKLLSGEITIPEAEAKIMEAKYEQ